MSSRAERYTAELVITDRKTGEELHFFVAGKSPKGLKHWLYKLSFRDLFGEEAQALKAWKIENKIEVKR